MTKTQFQPTNAQRRLLEYVHAHPGYHTVTELCSGAEVSRTSYYEWCHDPDFRAWLTREWSSLVMFEGWHTLNLVRASVVKSPAALRVLSNLIFDSRGQMALDGWCNRCATPTATVNPIAEQDQQLSPENRTFLKVPEPNPTKVVRLLSASIEKAQSL